jgi:hypothetical protein
MGCKVYNIDPATYVRCQSSSKVTVTSRGTKKQTSELTGRHIGVFQELSHVVQGSRLVKEAKKYLRAHAMMTL